MHVCAFSVAKPTRLVTAIDRFRSQLEPRGTEGGKYKQGEPSLPQLISALQGVSTLLTNLRRRPLTAP